MPDHSLHGRGELPLEGGINVTSLVDVAFVLLIIFMITAPIMQGGVDVQLPQGDAAPIQPREGLVVSVDSEGQIYIDNDQTGLSYDDFRASFPALVRARDPNGIYLRGDRRAAYGLVVRVLAVMQASGVDNIGMVLEDEEIRR